MRRVYHYNYGPRGKPPFAWVPGFCSGLPLASCCFVWALFCLLLLVSILTILRHLI